MESKKINEVLKIYNQITDLNKDLETKISILNLNEFTEFMKLKEHLKTYCCKLYNCNKKH